MPSAQCPAKSAPFAILLFSQNLLFDCHGTGAIGGGQQALLTQCLFHQVGNVCAVTSLRPRLGVQSKGSCQLLTSLDAVTATKIKTTGYPAQAEADDVTAQRRARFSITLIDILKRCDDGLLYLFIELSAGKLLFLGVENIDTIAQMAG